MTLNDAIERLYALKVDTTTRDGDGTPHEKPHKPLLLLAVFDLIDQGLATPDHIPWCQALRDRFSARFEVVRKLNDRNNQGSAGVSPASLFSDAAKMAALPTNGLALCKNHHWAMDRDLIAPAPDHHWHVSAILDARRSTGEEQLLTLAGKSLLLPKDQAFHPDAEGLEWRLIKLTA